ncbi:MAG: hypothetical protein P8Y42_08845 [Exilibacterium sp.]
MTAEATNSTSTALGNAPKRRTLLTLMSAGICQVVPLCAHATQLLLNALRPNPEGKLLVTPSYSPEHGDFTTGAAMSQQIVFDLLRNTGDAGTTYFLVKRKQPD